MLKLAISIYDMKGNIIGDTFIMRVKSLDQVKKASENEDHVLSNMKIMKYSKVNYKVLEGPRNKIIYEKTYTI